MSSFALSAALFVVFVLRLELHDRLLCKERARGRERYRGIDSGGGTKGFRASLLASIISFEQVMFSGLCDQLQRQNSTEHVTCVCVCM